MMRNEREHVHATRDYMQLQEDVNILFNAHHADASQIFPNTQTIFISETTEYKQHTKLGDKQFLDTIFL